MMTPVRKISLAVYKFSSCDGCQLSLLNLEDELLELTEYVDIAYFLEARREFHPGPYDVGLVEGSVSTEEEKRRIKEIRGDCQMLIALGTCATAGGVQALRNFDDVVAFTDTVYPQPEYVHALPISSPIKDHVQVDLELWGCPVNKYQVLEVITALLQNRRPTVPQYSICLDCKRNNNTCIMVAKGIPCLGPITRSGCGAICPSYNRGCYGCFGPVPNAEIEAFLPILQEAERHPGEGLRLLRTISGYAPEFKRAADILNRAEDQK